MELTGSQLIEATQEKVWDALNNVDILRRSIPGCESMQQEPDSTSVFRATLAARVGPIAARFKSRIEITQIVPPESYKLSFEGQGGVAGMVKGNFAVRLTPDGHSTQLAFSGNAQVGGKLAQIGARLVDMAAKRTIIDFFSTFKLIVTENSEALESARSSDGTQRD